MSDTQLVALSIQNEASALDLLEQLQAIDTNDENVNIVDAVIATKNGSGHIRLKQTKDKGFFKGGLGGVLVGIIVGAVVAGLLGAFVVAQGGELGGRAVGILSGTLMAALLGAVVGGVVGGLGAGIFAHFQDTGIDDDLMRKMARNLHAGEAALFILFSGDWSRSNRALQGALRTHGIRYMDQSLPVSIAAVTQADSQETGAGEAIVADDIAVAEDEALQAETEVDVATAQVVAVADDTGLADTDLVDTKLANSEDVDATRALLGFISQGSRDHGIKLSRLAGDLETVSQTIGEHELPVLAAILGVSGRRLQGIAANVFVRAATARRLDEDMGVAGQQSGPPDVDKFDETAARQVVSKLAAESGADLEAAGLPVDAN